MTRVKVCCIGSRDEARLAVRLGASALGLVSEMPTGTGVIPETRIAEIAAAVPPPIATFLLTSRTDAAGIVDQQQRCGVNTLQLCDRVTPAVRAELRRSLPGISLVQVVHVTGERAVAEALEVAPEVDALLLDTGNPDAADPAERELGGTGRTHEWSYSARIAKASPVPVFLAGGLSAQNVGEAIRTVRPFGVDLCSRIRHEGALDERKLSAFMAAVAAA
ncbi:MAG: phosphoribosylanthranilate isomerase [Proteobacteria bacterium]|nr:phosphoribosylanthranilate isomerase [Pseudomonadota bacterium]